MIRTHYDNLQVARNASDRVIKAAYKSLAHEWHPDRNADRRDEAERNMKIINEAYRVLSDPEMRQQHDEWLRRSEEDSHHQRYGRGANTGHPREPLQGHRPEDENTRHRNNYSVENQYSQNQQQSRESNSSSRETTEDKGHSDGLQTSHHWRRFFAFFIDALIMLPVGLAVGIVYGMTADLSSMTQSELDSRFNAIGYLMAWLYFALMESSKYQATLGKLLMKLRVADMSGDRLGFWHASGRHWGKLISAILLLAGFVMIFFTEKRQGLHDKMAGCIVTPRGDIPPAVDDKGSSAISDRIRYIANEFLSLTLMLFIGCMIVIVYYKYMSSVFGEDRGWAYTLGAILGNIEGRRSDAGLLSFLLPVILPYLAFKFLFKSKFYWEAVALWMLAMLLGHLFIDTWYQFMLDYQYGYGSDPDPKIARSWGYVWGSVMMIGPLMALILWFIPKDGLFQKRILLRQEDDKFTLRWSSYSIFILSAVVWAIWIWAYLETV